MSNNNTATSGRVFEFDGAVKPAKAKAKRSTGVIVADPMDHPYSIGDVYLIRTVTMVDTGRIKSIHPHEIVLTEASWIPDTGRFSDALKTCDFNECEPFPDGEVIIGRNAIIDAVRIQRAPRKQK